MWKAPHWRATRPSSTSALFASTRREISAPYCAALEGVQSLLDQGALGVHQTGDFGAVLGGAGGDGINVGFVVLADVGGVGARHSTLFPHPGDGTRGVEPSGECDADSFADGETAQDL
jgi:hypothetical protein